MNEQKFVKTYYSQPDKKKRVDVLIGRGYKNIGVNYNNEEVALFNSSDDLIRTREIITPDNTVIHLTYLPSSMEFEVVLDGAQIDDSVTSPKKVIAALRIPYLAGIFWYFVVLAFSFRFSALANWSFEDMITDPFSADVFYFITSSFIVFVLLISGLLFLPKGNMIFYKTVFFLIIADLLYGLSYQAIAFFFIQGGVKLIFLAGIIFSAGFKIAILIAMLKNWPRYNRFAQIRRNPQARFDQSLVDQ